MPIYENLISQFSLESHHLCSVSRIIWQNLIPLENTLTNDLTTCNFALAAPAFCYYVRFESSFWIIMKCMDFIVACQRQFCTWFNSKLIKSLRAQQCRAIKICSRGFSIYCMLQWLMSGEYSWIVQYRHFSWKRDNDREIMKNWISNFHSDKYFRLNEKIIFNSNQYIIRIDPNIKWCWG